MRALFGRTWVGPLPTALPATAIQCGRRREARRAWNLGSNARRDRGRRRLRRIEKNGTHDSGFDPARRPRRRCQQLCEHVQPSASTGAGSRQGAHRAMAMPVLGGVGIDVDRRGVIVAAPLGQRFDDGRDVEVLVPRFNELPVFTNRVRRRNLVQNREERGDREDGHRERRDPRAPPSTPPWRRCRLETWQGAHSHLGFMVPTSRKSALSRGTAPGRDERSCQ
jgi:hypothetical protein